MKSAVFANHYLLTQFNVLVNGVCNYCWMEGSGMHKLFSNAFVDLAILLETDVNGEDLPVFYEYVSSQVLVFDQKISAMGLTSDKETTSL